jgi:hypothetical protein
MFFAHNFIPLAFALARLLCLMNGFFQKNRAFEKHVLFKNSLGVGKKNWQKQSGFVSLALFV